MLKPRKRLTRREIRQDKFVILTFKVTNFVRKNLGRIVGLILAVILTVVVTCAFVKHKSQRRIDAAETFAEARIEQDIELFQRVADDFRGTRSAGEALVALGNIHFEAGRYEEAIVSFKAYLDDYGDDDILAYTSWIGIAASLEEQGKYWEAAGKYKGFADENPSSPFTPMCLFEAARCFILAGEKEEAELALREILDLYPDSQIAYQARNEMKMLSSDW